MFSGGYDYISVIKEQITLARYSPGITWEDSENMLDFEREMAVDVLTNMINKEVEEMKKNMETNKK